MKHKEREPIYMRIRKYTVNELTDMKLCHLLYIEKSIKKEIYRLKRLYKNKIKNNNFDFEFIKQLIQMYEKATLSSRWISGIINLKKLFVCKYANKRRF